MEPLNREEIRLLAEVGFLAVSKADTASSNIIFAALEQLRPRQNFSYIGLALGHLNEQDHYMALKVLDRGRANADPDQLPELLRFSGLALHLAGRNAESRALLQKAGDTALTKAILAETMP